MKKSVIKDMFLGFRGHVETMIMPKESKDKLDIADDINSVMKEKLSKELFHLYQKAVKAFEDEWSKEIDFYFVEGFKLGLLIGIECMDE